MYTNLLIKINQSEILLGQPNLITKLWKNVSLHRSRTKLLFCLQYPLDCICTWYRCERFNYGGCGGNNNRFTSLQSCNRKCNPSGECTHHCIHYSRRVPVIKHQPHQLTSEFAELYEFCSLFVSQNDTVACWISLYNCVRENKILNIFCHHFNQELNT